MPGCRGWLPQKRRAPPPAGGRASRRRHGECHQGGSLRWEDWAVKHFFEFLVEFVEVIRDPDCIPELAALPCLGTPPDPRFPHHSPKSLSQPTRQRRFHLLRVGIFHATSGRHLEHFNLSLLLLQVPVHLVIVAL